MCTSYDDLPCLEVSKYMTFAKFAQRRIMANCNWVFPTHENALWGGADRGVLGSQNYNLHDTIDSLMPCAYYTGNNNTYQRHCGVYLSYTLCAVDEG